VDNKKAVTLGGMSPTPRQAIFQAQDRMRGEQPAPMKPAAPGGVPGTSRREAAATTGVSPRPAGSPVLSQKTQDGLLEAATVAQAQKDQEAEKPEEDAKEADAGLFDDLFSGYGRSEADRVLNNKDRRKRIEAALHPLSIRELIERNSVSQEIVIIPDSFSIVLRSVTEYEHQSILRWALKPPEKGTRSESEVNNRVTLGLLAASLVKLNDKLLPEHLNPDGDFIENTFETKVKMLAKKSSYLLTDIQLQY
jgi:hypothetical protein